MPTASTSAYGTILKWNAVEVGELTSISGPTQKLKSIEVTSMDSPNGYAEFIAGIIDGGQVQVEGNFTNAAGQAALQSDFQAKTQRQLVITLPTSHTWTAQAICVDFSEDFKVNDRITFKATFQVTGEPVFA